VAREVETDMKKRGSPETVVQTHHCATRGARTSVTLTLTPENVYRGTCRWCGAELETDLRLTEIRRGTADPKKTR